MNETQPEKIGNDQWRKLWPGLAVFAVLVATAFQLRHQGRLWVCACGRFLPWLGDAWSSETSQQLFDPYSFTHVLHGFVFCGLLAWGLPRLPWTWQLALAVAGESLWEVVENTEFVIQRYRETTAALGYNGDTIVNSLGDVIACAFGFLLARKLGLLRTALIFAATEVVLLFWIRDSLLLNVLMLIYPSDKLRAWQSSH